MIHRLAPLQELRCATHGLMLDAVVNADLDLRAVRWNAVGAEPYQYGQACLFWLRGQHPAVGMVRKGFLFWWDTPGLTQCRLELYVRVQLNRIKASAFATDLLAVIAQVGAMGRAA